VAFIVITLLGAIENHGGHDFAKMSRFAVFFAKML